MGDIAFFSLTAAFNPTLLAATTLMLFLPGPSRLMLGYLLGAMTTSITIGLVLVFAISSHGPAKTAQRTLSPVADIALGCLALLISFVLSRLPRDGSHARRARRKKGSDGPPRWQRALSGGSPRSAFVIGALLTLPGASYLAALHSLKQQSLSAIAEVLIVVGINLVMLALIEVPLISFAVAPDWTPQAIERAKAAIGRHWRTVVVRASAAVGVALVVKGVLGLIAG